MKDDAELPGIVPLHTRDVGSGEPAVLFLHAFPLNGGMWEGQLGALAGRTRLLVPDLPGFGGSPSPRPPVTLEGYADSVMTLLESLTVERTVVVGLSMGGYLAFRLIERLGDRLAGLLLANTRSGPDTEEAAAARRSAAEDIERDGIGIAADRFLPRLIGATTQRVDPSVAVRARKMIAENMPAGIAGALRAMAERPDSTRLLAGVRCPVLCIGSDEDVLMPPDVAAEMAARAPRGRVEIIRGAGHLSNLEAPAAFNRVLDAFLRECGHADIPAIGKAPKSS